MPLVGEPSLNPITGQVVRYYQLKPFVQSVGSKPYPPQWSAITQQDDVKQRSASPCYSTANATVLSTTPPCGLKKMDSSGKGATAKYSPKQTQWNW